MSYIRRVLMATLASLLIATGMLGVATAQSSGQKVPGSGLSITPTRTELTVLPGDSKDFTVTLKNITGGDIIAKPIINDFTSDNFSGEPKIITDTTKTSPTSIKPFIKGLPAEITFKKDERKDLPVTVSVPAGQSAGAYYGVLRFTAVPVGQEAPKGGEVALTASVGTIVLLEVPGNITKQIQVNNVQAVYKKDNKTAAKASSFYTANKPNKIQTEIKNTGNTFAKPIGKVNVSSTFDKNVYTYEFNNTNPRSNILPGSTRTFVDDLKNISLPGKYTIQASVAADVSGEVVNYQSSFWYVPIWMILLVIALIVLLIVGIVYLVRRSRK